MGLLLAESGHSEQMQHPAPRGKEKPRQGKRGAAIMGSPAASNGSVVWFREMLPMAENGWEKFDRTTQERVTRVERR